MLVSLKKEKYYFYATLTSAITNVVLNLILVPFFGLNATAVTTVISEVIVVLICRHYSLPLIKYKEKINLNSIGIGCIGIVVSCILCNLVVSNLIPKIFISIVLSVMAYFAILISLGNEVAKEFLASAKKRVFNNKE